MTGIKEEKPTRQAEKRDLYRQTSNAGEKGTPGTQGGTEL
jgi:hypothetical protein